MSIMDKGRHTEPFEKLKSDQRTRMRVGKAVPAGATNIAYVHTPAITADEGVSFIDTAYINENMIPISQRESLAIADEQGYLQYAAYLSKDQVIIKDPVRNFPSSDIQLTKDFYEDEIGLNSAMYYQISIDYHYDKIRSTANKDGSFTPVPYQGDQIHITDLEGNNLLLNEELKAKIYVQGIFGYPNAYHIIVYLNKITTENETICIRYNHIDAPRNEGEIQSVKGRVELYVDRANTIKVEGKTKHMMESGKIRILNECTHYRQESKIAVINEQTSQNPRMIYAIEERIDGKGYQVLVPDRTENDPRQPKEFQYMILAEYRNKEGKLVKHSTGLIEDHLLHPEVLLSSDRPRYNSGYKTIGLLSGQDILNAKDSIQSSLPITTPALPETTIYSIVDTEGNVFYSSSKNIQSKADVDTIITEGYARATSMSLTNKKWPLANRANTALQEIPFSHQFSIVPEHQITKWGFEFTLDGQGEIYKTKGGGQWVPWTTKDTQVPLTIKGVGTIEYFSDGTFKVDFSPRAIPDDFELPEGVRNFRWRQPILTIGNNLTIKRVGKAIQVTPYSPEITPIGRIWYSDELTIQAKDKMKELFKIENESWRELFNIPDHIPSSEILLRIERGHTIDMMTSKNPTHEVNYRFRAVKGGTVRYPVDQYQDQLGMNRVRMKDVVNKKGHIDESVQLHVVGWTTKTNYRSIPIYAVKINETRHIYANPPRVEEGTQKHLSWHPVVKNGLMTKRMVMPIIEDETNPPAIYKQYPPLVSYASTVDHQQELDFVYGVPEYNRQEFFNKPILLISAERPKLLTNRSLQVKNKNIVTNRKDKQLYTNRVWIENKDGIKELRISDIDKVKGIFYLHDYISEEDIVYVTYQYEEEYYEYRGFPLAKTSYATKTESQSVMVEYQMSISMNALNEYIPEGPRIIEFGPHGLPINQKICYSELVDDKLRLTTYATDDELLKLMKLTVDGSEVITQNLNTPSTQGMTQQVPIIVPEKVLGSKEDLTQVPKVDIVFIFDTSGSMQPYIDGVKENLNTFKNSLMAENLDVYMGYIDSVPQTKELHQELIPMTQFSLDAIYLNWGGWENLRWLNLTDPETGAMSLSHSFREGSDRIFLVISDSYMFDQPTQNQIDTLLENNVTVHTAIMPHYFNDPGYKTMVNATGGTMFDLTSPTLDIELKNLALNISNETVKYYPDKTYTIGLEVTDITGYSSKRSISVTLTDCAYHGGNET